MIKKINRLLSIIIIILAMLIVGCNNNYSKKEKIIMSVTDNQFVMLNNIVEKFNEKNQEYYIEFETNSSEQIKNYKLEHNVLKGDIIAFESYIEANNYANELIDLKTKEFVNNYQVNIINYLKTLNDGLFVLPSIGKFYSNCYNLDLIKNYNYAIPNSLSELITLAQRNETKLDNKKHFKTSSTVGGNDSLSVALMQIAFPYFLSTTKGNFFLKEYIAGVSKMNSEEYKDYFSTIFKNLLYLYDLKFYSLDDINQSFENGVNEFSDEKTILIQSSVEYPLNREIGDMNCSFVSFVGKENNQNWIASKPLYYLAARKNSNIKIEEGIYEFFKFYSSTEGQNELMKYDLKRESSNNNFVSYLKDSYIELDDIYYEVENVIKTGRVYLIDLFEYIFEKNVDVIISYLKKEVSIDTLFITIDDKMASLINKQRVKINCDGSFDFETKNINQEETLIGNFIADSINKQMNSANAVCLPSDVIKANIYSDGIYLDELDVVLENNEIVYAKIQIKDLTDIIQKLIQVEELPLISGIRIKYKDNNLKIYNINNKEFDSEDYINIVIDTNLIKGYNNIIIGKKYKILDVFTEYLKSVNAIEVPNIDNRYGE